MSRTSSAKYHLKWTVTSSNISYVSYPRAAPTFSTQTSHDKTSSATGWWAATPQPIKLTSIINTMNKVEHDNFVTWFVPPMFLMPQHNLVKEGKKDSLIFNAVKQPTMDSIPIKLMTSKKHGKGHNCTFEKVMANFLIYI